MPRYSYRENLWKTDEQKSRYAWPVNCWPATSRRSVLCSSVLPICHHRPVLHPPGTSTYAINRTMATMKKVIHHTSTQSINQTPNYLYQNKQHIVFANNRLFLKRFQISNNLLFYFRTVILGGAGRICERQTNKEENDKARDTSRRADVLVQNIRRTNTAVVATCFCSDFQFPTEL